jgi:chromosome segregation ATPase
MTDTTHPSPSPRPTPTAAQLAKAAEALRQEVRKVEEQRKVAERQEAQETARKEELQRKADEAAAILDRARDSVWSAPITSLAGVAGLAASLNAAVAEYRTTLDALGVPRWDQDVVLGRHPIMAAMPWLSQTFPARVDQG